MISPLRILLKYLDREAQVADTEQVAFDTSGRWLIFERDVDTHVYGLTESLFRWHSGWCHGLDHTPLAS